MSAIDEAVLRAPQVKLSGGKVFVLILTCAMIMLSDSENAMGRAAEYGKLYQDLPLDTAQRTIRFWRLRRAEGHAA